jgi:hypothetical protein
MKGGKYHSEFERLTIECDFLGEPRAAVAEQSHQAREISEAETSTRKAKWNDTRTRLPGTREGRIGAAAIGGSAAQIPMEGVTPSVVPSKLTRAKYQSERNQP